MSFSESISKAQARRHARANNWTAFEQVANELAQNIRHSYSQDNTEWMATLWYEFVLDNEQEPLVQYSQWLVDKKTRGSCAFRIPSLASLVDGASKDARTQWIFEREELRPIWIAATDVPVPNKTWRAQHGITTDITKRYHAWMLAQPQDVQERQKEYIEHYGCQVLLKKPLLYHAICAYGTPTKEQVRAAALASTSTFDMVRLEEHYPGISGLRSACEGMGLKGTALREEMRKFMDGPNALEELIPQEGFEFV